MAFYSVEYALGLAIYSTTKNIFFHYINDHFTLLITLWCERYFKYKTLGSFFRNHVRGRKQNRELFGR